MMRWWCADDALMMHWWCVDNVLMMHWWCTDDALMMHWWCTDDALMMHWWCIDDALMMHWWCADDAWVSYLISLNPQLFKNIAQVWSFMNFVFVFVIVFVFVFVFVCVFVIVIVMADVFLFPMMYDMWGLTWIWDDLKGLYWKCWSDERHMDSPAEFPLIDSIPSVGGVGWKIETIVFNFSHTLITWPVKGEIFYPGTYQFSLWEPQQISAWKLFANVSLDSSLYSCD